MQNEIELTLPSILDGEDKSSSFINCLRNNTKHLRKWAKRTHTNCFRLYDREVPQYPLAIDFYGGRYCVHYFSKGQDTDEPAPSLIESTNQALKTLFGVESPSIFWRTRAKSKETRQYEKSGSSGHFFTVYEFGVKFRINLEDYLDTGLFLDHRETRQLVASVCKGKRVLNLFAYTCSFSVHAAVAGAIYTKSVDMSNTYTAWGKENFILNSIPLKNHEIVRADCLKFLEEEVRLGKKYDVIIIDPPTISRSKKMDQLFDIQEDYIHLFSKSLNLLSDEGIIFFSTNSRKFTLDSSLFPTCSIEEISHKTLPIDFKDPKIHRCWQIKRRNG